MPEEYTIADTLENIATDEAGLVEGAASYTLTDDFEGFDYAGLTEDEQLLVDGAENGADFGGNTDGGDGGDNGEFGLASALENLQDANAAQAGFLEGLDLDDNPETATTEADVADALQEAVANVDGEVEGDYAGSSANVRAALLADQQASNTAELTQAQETLTDAQAAVAEVDGLEQAVADLQSAQTALENAQKAAANTAAAQAGAEASYESLNASIEINEENGTVADMIVENDAGNLVLADGVTEEDNEGVTDLLNAIKADQAADAAVVDANVSVEATQEVVNNLDLTEGAQTALEAVATEMELAEGELPTQSQIQAEIDGLQALVDTAQAAAEEDAAALRADADAAAAADTAEATDADQLRADATAAEAADTAEETDATVLRADAAAAAAVDTAEDTDADQLRADANDAETLRDNYEAAQIAAGEADAETDNSGESATNLAAIKAAFASATGALPDDLTAVDEATTDQGALDLIAGFVSTYTQAAKDADAAATTAEQADTAAQNALAGSSFETVAEAAAADDAQLETDAAAAEQADTAAQDALAGSSFETVVEAAAADAAQLETDAAAAEQADTAAQDALAGSSFETVTEAAAADAAQLEADATAAENADADVTTAQTNLDAFKALVTTYEAANDDNPRLDELDNAETGVENAQQSIDDLNEALAGLETAQNNAETLEGLNDAIEDAEAAFADNGFETPVTIDGNELATAESDIFLLGEEDGAIANFGLLGDDTLYVGTEFTQTDLAGDAVFTGSEGAQGDASALEVFVQQKGNNTVLTFENEAFAGSSSSDADLTEVTLTGVTGDVSISDDGFLTIA